MEQLLLERFKRHIDSNSDHHCRLQALASARALLINPNSSESTRSTVLDVLIRFLDQEHDPTILRHVIKLLGDAVVIHYPLAPSVVSAVRSLLSGGKSLAAEALAVLIYVAGSGGEGGGISAVGSVLDEDLILSLASSPILSVRSMLLDLLVLSVDGDQNFTLLRPHLIFQVFLGLSVDLHPSVRRVALDGLVAFCKNEGDEHYLPLVCGCYDRAVMLLRDEDELVRMAAIRLVSECGQMFSVNKEHVDNIERMDAIFVQLCSMARDMNMKVRVEAYVALGKVKLVSEGVLLQSLYKKVLEMRNGKKTVAKCFTKESKFPLSSSAGVFVHAIEDEFYEVRTAACKSLGMLTSLSTQFSDDALNLLMDIVNDDVTVVRLQTLQTLFHMAAQDRLKVQEKHMHMFLGLLADISALIRHVAREVLRLMKLPDMEIFKSSIDGLLINLETYPKDEEDIFFSLFCIGKNHGNFTASLVKVSAQEILPSCEGELSLDRPRVAALLVLAISSPSSFGQANCDFRAHIFSCAVPLLGRISCSLRGIMNRDSLLAYLCYHSGRPFSTTILNSKKDELSLHAVEDKTSHQIFSSSWSYHNMNSEIQLKKKLLDLGQVSTALEQLQQKDEYLDEEVIHAIKLILRTVAETWPLIQSRCTHQVLRTLRVCKEELEMISWNTNGSARALLAFASHYVQVIQLVAEIWKQLQPKKLHVMDLLLEKLDLVLRKMRYCFPGLSKVEECHILELILLACVVRLSKVGICPSLMLKKLHAIIDRLEFLCEEGLSELSNFAKELKRSCSEGRPDEVPSLFPVHRLLEQFFLKQIPVSGRFKYIKAELQVLGNDSENPLPFIPGLPVDIAFHITLYNISNSDRLWLRMAVGKSIQYVFLDLCEFGGCDEVRKCTVKLPFYASPKTVSFLLRACIGMECPPEGITDLKKGQGGPKCEMTLLCEEIDVYLVKIEKDLLTA